MRGVFVKAIIVLAQIGLGTGVAGATDGAQINVEGTEGLNKLLAWSIEHSNLTDLGEQARMADADQAGSFNPKRLAELKEIMQQMNQEPSDVDLMKQAIDIIRNSSSSIDQQEQALTALRYLVEPFDNAKDLPGLGGLQVLLDVLRNPASTGVHVGALHALGTAASNHPDFQQQAIDTPHLVASLCESLRSTSADVVKKALYATATLIRNNHLGQQLFYHGSGVKILESLIAKPFNTPILRKALDLLHDLADAEDKHLASQNLAHKSLVQQLLNLVMHPDHDVQERALLTLISFSKRPETLSLLRRSDAHRAVASARQKYAAISIDADEEYREDLKQYLLLLADLEDCLHDNSDKWEL